MSSHVEPATIIPRGVARSKVVVCAAALA